MDMFDARQGDIRIKGCSRIPSDAKPVPTQMGWHILAEGEVTGHYHAVRGKKSVENTEMFTREVDGKEVLYLKVNAATAEEPVTITHDEHDPIIISKPGLYSSHRQLEYFEGEQRQVID